MLHALLHPDPDRHELCAWWLHGERLGIRGHIRDEIMALEQVVADSAATILVPGSFNALSRLHAGPRMEEQISLVQGVGIFPINLVAGVVTKSGQRASGCGRGGGGEDSFALASPPSRRWPSMILCAQRVRWRSKIVLTSGLAAGCARRLHRMSAIDRHRVLQLTEGLEGRSSVAKGRRQH